jgi:predicted dehydrogenase
MSDLLIGVIGYGNRGQLAHVAHHPDQGVRVTSAADVSEKNLARFRDKFGADAFTTTDYRRLLERKELGAVLITSPDFLHEEHAVAALEAGKAVFLEKPMAITIEGCDRILHAARNFRGRLYVGHNMRHMTVMRKIKELIDAGKIGQVKAGWCRHYISYGGDAYFKDWHSERSKATGLLLQKGAHDIDMLHWFCGGYTRRTTAVGNLSVFNQITDRVAPGETAVFRGNTTEWPPLKHKNLNRTIDVEDLSMMLMELDNGVLASYQQCHYAPDAWRNYTIIGTEGRLENFGDQPGETVIRVWTRKTSYNPYGDEQHFIPQVRGGHGGADPEIIGEFIRYVQQGGKIETSAIAARQSVAAGCQATESLRHGSAPRDIPPIDPALLAYFDDQR